MKNICRSLSAKLQMFGWIIPEELSELTEFKNKFQNFDVMVLIIIKYPFTLTTLTPSP